MESPLVSAVEWWRKNGKWTCSLICFDGAFSQIWLEPDARFSLVVQPGQYCVGYTTLSSRTSVAQVDLEPWKAMAPCPSASKLEKGHKCHVCYQADLVQSCLMCDGTRCSAEPSIQGTCQRATAYVYIASFGSDRIKVGVAHSSRIPQRWIEQGANLAKRVIVGNGMEARRFENAIHKALDVLPGLKTNKKIDTLWKKQNSEAEAHAIAKAEEEVKKRFPSFPFYQEPVRDLSDIYSLPPLDRRPIELRVKENLQISGEILGTKGSLLLLGIGNLPYFLNLNHLLGRRIAPKEACTTVMQTALDRF